MIKFISILILLSCTVFAGSKSSELPSLYTNEKGVTMMKMGNWVCTSEGLCITQVGDVTYGYGRDGSSFIKQNGHTYVSDGKQTVDTNDITGKVTVSSIIGGSK
jgi:hypothetical protein